MKKLKTNNKISIKQYAFKKSVAAKRANDFKMRRDLIFVAVIFIMLTMTLLLSLVPNKIVETDETVTQTENQNDAEEIVHISNQPNTIDEAPVNLKKYMDQNSDTVGYIRIEGTNIDYPVVQSDNNEYYINRDFETCPNKSGAIFLDFRCDVNDFSKTRNMIIYGHRMQDGSMFKDLTKYQDEDFFLENRIIQFDTLNGGYKWKVFAVFETTTDFYYIDTDFPYDEVWLAFLNEAKNYSIYNTLTNFYPNDIVLTLSTCSMEENGRLVIMAKLLQ